VLLKTHPRDERFLWTTFRQFASMKTKGVEMVDASEAHRRFCTARRRGRRRSSLAPDAMHSSSTRRAVQAGAPTTASILRRACDGGRQSSCDVRPSRRVMQLVATDSPPPIDVLRT
jgi:hypothetical protein